MGSISQPDWLTSAHPWVILVYLWTLMWGSCFSGEKGCWSISAKTVNIRIRQVHMGIRKSQNVTAVCERQLHLLRLGLWGRQEAGLIAEEWEPGSPCGWKGQERIPSQYQHWIHWVMEWLFPGAKGPYFEFKKQARLCSKSCFRLRCFSV